MARVSRKQVVVAVIVAVLLGVVSSARAQTIDSPWRVSAAIGWDNGISGHINASGIGEINSQVVVITKNSYEDVYGTGLNFQLGAGYLFKEATEARVTFTIQSLDADFVVPMGDMGSSNLYGQYTDYQIFSLDFGVRRYAELRSRLSAYGEAAIGVGFVEKTDVTLVAPGANFVGEANDFYDQAAVLTLGANVGLLAQTGTRVGVFGQLGLRWVSGMADIDDLVGTGLDTINDKSTRITLPFVAGVQFRF